MIEWVNQEEPRSRRLLRSGTGLRCRWGDREPCHSYLWRISNGRPRCVEVQGTKGSSIIRGDCDWATQAGISWSFSELSSNGMPQFGRWRKERLPLRTVDQGCVLPVLCSNTRTSLSTLHHSTLSALTEYADVQMSASFQIEYSKTTIKVLL